MGSFSLDPLQDDLRSNYLGPFPWEHSLVPRLLNVPNRSTMWTMRSRSTPWLNMG